MDATTPPLKPLQACRALFALLLAVPATFLISTLALVDLILIRRDAHKAQVWPRTWARIICRLSGVRAQFSGMEHLDPAATYIYVGNHASQFDIFCFQGYFEHDFRWIAKQELFRIPLFGPAMKQAGIIPINRSKGRAALKSLGKAAERIRNGCSVLLFPEGTRSRDGRLQPFKSGAALLAVKAGIPLVPVGFNNTHALLPKGAWLPRPGIARIRIGPPIDVGEYSARDKQLLTQRLEEAVSSQLEPQHQPLDHAPPA